MVLAALSVGDTNSARKGHEALSAATRLAPDLPDVRIARGFQYLMEQRDPQRAMQEFEWVMKLVPSSPAASVGVGTARMMQGRTAEALDSFEEAMALDPRNAEAANGAYGSAFHMRDSVKARRYVDRLIAIQPDNPLPYGYKAVLAASLGGNPREAAAVMREAVARVGAPAAAFVIIDAPLTVLAHVDTVTQRALIAVALNAFPGDTADYYFFKAALHRTRRERALERHYADSVIRFLEARNQPANNSTWVGRTYTLAMSYAQLGRATEAVALAKQAVERPPVNQQALERKVALQILAEVYALLGQDNAAIDQLEYLLSIPSNVSIPWLRIGAPWDSLRDSPRFQRLLEQDSKR